MSEQNRFYQYLKDSEGIPLSDVRLLYPYYGGVDGTKMHISLNYVDIECEECGYGSEADITIRVLCDNRQRVIHWRKITLYGG